MKGGQWNSKTKTIKFGTGKRRTIGLTPVRMNKCFMKGVMEQSCSRLVTHLIRLFTFLLFAKPELRQLFLHFSGEESSIVLGCMEVKEPLKL